MPILTLTSDIGQLDYLMGAIKGRILSVRQDFQVVDISHSIIPFNYSHAAYVCRNAFRQFPVGSFHMVLVNLFDSKMSHLLLARHEGQYIGIADNGLLSMILEGEPEELVAIPLEPSRKKDSLHFADVFARAFADLATGESLQSIGDQNIQMRIKTILRPKSDEGWIEGQIIYIDPFENVVVNITREAFEAQRKGRAFRIVFLRNEVIDRISETYADVPEGEKLALFNAAGYLEIAINKGNAAGLFGLQPFAANALGMPQKSLQSKLFYQIIRVYFE